MVASLAQACAILRVFQTHLRCQGRGSLGNGKWKQETRQLIWAQVSLRAFWLWKWWLLRRTRCQRCANRCDRPMAHILCDIQFWLLHFGARPSPPGPHPQVGLLWKSCLDLDFSQSFKNWNFVKGFLLMLVYCEINFLWFQGCHFCDCHQRAGKCWWSQPTFVHALNRQAGWGHEVPSAKGCLLCAGRSKGTQTQEGGADSKTTFLKTQTCNKSLQNYGQSVKYLTRKL